MPYIYIVPIATPGSNWLVPFEQTMAQCFGLPVKRMHCDINLEMTYDPSPASKILLQLIRSTPSDAVKILIGAAVDLFIPILT